MTSIAIRPFQFGYLPSTHRRGQDDRNRNTRHPGGRAVLGLRELHAGLSEAKKTVDGSYGKQDGRFKDQEPLVNVQAIIELAASYGPVAINRAYCNWQFFGRYRDALLQGAVELIQLFPPGQSAKNGADIKLCLDAAEDIVRFQHIGTVLVVGGDSDFMPVAQKIKAAGRKLVGVGTRRTTNRHWAKSCYDFRYYETLSTRRVSLRVLPRQIGPRCRRRC